MIIYKTTNLLNGKIYVGKDCNNNPGYLGSGSNLRKDIKLLGRAAFKKEILEFCDLSNIDAREISWIKVLDARNPVVGYNIAEGGDGGSSGPCSEETKRKIRSAQVGKPKNISEETRAGWYILRRGSGNPFFGRRHTDEARKRNAVLHVGKQATEETRQKISLANKGKKRSDEAKQNYRAARLGRPSPFLGMHHSAISKQRISTANTGRRGGFVGKQHSEETKRRMSESQKGFRAEHKWGHTEESKRRISIALTGHPSGMLGKRQTEETKRRIAESLKISYLKRQGAQLCPLI